jgi:hypothetical protein
MVFRPLSCGRGDYKAKAKAAQEAMISSVITLASKERMSNPLRLPALPRVLPIGEYSRIHIVEGLNPA